MHILVVEGNTPELALAVRRATGATPSHAFAATLKAIDETLTFSYAAPYFSDHDLGTYDFRAYDGAVVTGSGVAWSASDPAARAFWALYEKLFAAGAPAFGSGWGMQTAAVALGGDVVAAASPEVPVARAIRPGGHAMTEGRRESFDAFAMRRDEVGRLPSGAEIAASSETTEAQAFAYERGGVDFWGTLYQPECRPSDVAWWLGRRDASTGSADPAFAADLKRIDEDHVAYARLAATRRIGLDLLDPAYRRTELANWVDHLRSRTVHDGEGARPVA
ncbi:MAG: hypothetical protein AAGF90_07870 [Pseudomonadota bacterium]